MAISLDLTNEATRKAASALAPKDAQKPRVDAVSIPWCGQAG